MADLFGDLSLFGEFEKVCNKSFEKRPKTNNGPHLQKSMPVDGVGPCLSDDFDGDPFRSEPPIDASTGDQMQSLQKEIQTLKNCIADSQHHNRFHDIRRFESLGCPMVELLFLNKAFARNYQSRIENFLKVLIEEFLEDCKKSNLSQINVETAGNCNYFKDFILDVAGWPLLDFKQLLNDGCNRLRYEQVFKQSLPCENLENTETSSIKEKSVARVKSSCFNCGGEHNLNACPAKKDQQRINTARRQFMDKFPQALNVSNKRYHIEDDPRFSGMKPGIISNNLRQALGIGSSDLPPYIYQMRILGYPPGHLENAKLSTSGLSMFDKHGLELTSDGELLEDGEVNDETQSSNAEYNFDKIVEYPGFNVAVPPGTVDECETLGMPPMQPMSHKNLMRSQLFTKAMNSCKRKCDEVGPNNGKKKHQQATNLESVITIDMDIDADEAELEPAIQVLPTEPPKSGHLKAAPWPPLPPDLELPQPPLPDQSDSCIDLTSDNEEMTPNESKKLDQKSVLSTQASTPVHVRGHFGGSRSFCLGTPVVMPEIESTNSCSSLPDSSKFASGVSELIMHDNLPNATGTFKKLKSVLTDLKNQSHPSGCYASFSK